MRTRTPVFTKYCWKRPITRCAAPSRAHVSPAMRGRRRTPRPQGHEIRSERSASGVCERLDRDGVRRTEVDGLNQRGPLLRHALS